jgi:integral membrane protein (TIGR01906 family)
MSAALALSLAAWGLVAFAVYFAGSGTYAALARESGFAETPFLYPAGAADAAPRPTDLATRLAWHERWSAYVLGRSDDPLRGAAEVAFTEDEVRHMADVRRVFVAAQVLMSVGAVASILLIGLALRDGIRTAGLLMRNAGAWAGGVVLVVGAAAAVAFQPLFLAFHYVFFPQGNFLFPATSNLIRLYPEAYWYAVTLRVGGAFIATAVIVALVGWLMSRSGIVTRP